MSGKQLVIRLSSIIIKIALAVIVVIVLYKATMKCYDFGYRIFNEKAMESGDGREITVSIVQGKSAYQIGKILESKGLIRDAEVFFFQELLSGSHGKIKPGVYTLKTNMTADDMIKLMTTEQEEPEEEPE